MGRTLNRIYRKFASPGLFEVAEKYQLEYSWVIEAGCHDGSDTLRFLNKPNIRKVYAFEPDVVAANVAKEKFKGESERVLLRTIALYDRIGFIHLSSPTGKFGDGTTLISEFVEGDSSVLNQGELIPCSTLDVELKNLTGKGLIWLDVEGSAHKVLSGATKILQKVDLIQVEVDLHNSTFRDGNFFTVNRILRAQDFVIIYGPIHPGFFGDALYIRKSTLSLRGKLRCILLSNLMYVNHKIIFPLLHKPKE